MLLDGRVVIVYGAGGLVGSAMARAFAAEGARVHLAGRHLASLQPVAEEIRAAGGSAETAEVDALDEAQVDAHADAVAAAAGSIDVSLNVVSVGDVQGTPLVDMSLGDFEQPVHTAVRTTFLTTRAAARHMVRRGSGVLLFFGGIGDPVRGYSIGGFQVALAAVEMLQRQLSAELGPRGIRCVTIQTGGMVDGVLDQPEILEMVTGDTMLGRGATTTDAANAAVFAASDRASMITGSTINISGGSILP
jgi:3-oxoacyl-[acyl-carrier protein] reductase